MSVQVYFSDYFQIDPEVIEEYGALDVSLINDLPLFIDPFLLFESEKEEYKELHQELINYVIFLKDAALSGPLAEARFKSWFYFPEVKQNWLGFSKKGNQGAGLGKDFAEALSRNLRDRFSDFGEESVSQSPHLEKLCLVKEGVGRDNISDLTANIIKRYLLEYTQTFAQQHLRPDQRRTFPVDRVSFDYNLKRWKRGRFKLPVFNRDFVLLTPHDILTKEDTWINRTDLGESFVEIATSLPNPQLRQELSDMLIQALRANQTVSKRDVQEMATDLTLKYPEILDHFIRWKEEHGEKAKAISAERVGEVEDVFIRAVKSFVEQLDSVTEFYQTSDATFGEALRKAHFLKDVIENKDGYRLFYQGDKPITRESDLQILFRLTWEGTSSDVNREVNNGRGPADFTVSRGSRDKTVVEFKLASNNKLKQNLQNQTKIYERASNAKRSVKVIVYFYRADLAKVRRVLEDLKMVGDESVVLIDATGDKPSASKAKES